MDSYVTGAVIKHLREKKDMTQTDLAKKLDVSPKTISKWETARGLPDISLLDPLASALGVSVLELMSGNTVVNKNSSGNMLRSKFYCCPICGNILHSMGEAIVCCCGIALPPLEAEDTDDAHKAVIEPVEDEHFIVVDHDMTKTHYISFLAYVTTDTVHLVKLYPEGNAQCRFQIRGRGYLYLYCNHHGLMRQKI